MWNQQSMDIQEQIYSEEEIYQFYKARHNNFILEEEFFDF